MNALRWNVGSQHQWLLYSDPAKEFCSVGCRQAWAPGDTETRILASGWFLRHEGKCNNYIHIKGRLQKKLEDCKTSQTETRKNLTMLMKSDQISVPTHLRNLYLNGWTSNSYSETSDLNQNFFLQQIRTNDITEIGHHHGTLDSSVPSIQ